MKWNDERHAAPRTHALSISPFLYLQVPPPQDRHLVVGNQAREARGRRVAGAERGEEGIGVRRGHLFSFVWAETRACWRAAVHSEELDRLADAWVCGVECRAGAPGARATRPVLRE